MRILPVFERLVASLDAPSRSAIGVPIENDGCSRAWTGEDDVVSENEAIACFGEPEPAVVDQLLAQGGILVHGEIVGDRCTGAGQDSYLPIGFSNLFY